VATRIEYDAMFPNIRPAFASVASLTSASNVSGILGTGKESIVGYADTINEPKALAGDKRIYARDSSGAVVVEVWLKNTGEAEISNANGSVFLRPDGGTIITTPESTFDAKADGSIKGSNNNGSFELQTDGGSVTATPLCTFEAKADGSIKGSNANGSFELQTGGDFLVNGVTIDTSGNITSPATITGVNLVGSTSVVANGKELAGHKHPAGTLKDSVPLAVTGDTGDNS